MLTNKKRSLEFEFLAVAEGVQIGGFLESGRDFCQ